MPEGEGFPVVPSPPIHESRSFTVKARWLQEGEFRLDAQYHAEEAAAAQRILEDCGVSLVKLGSPDVTREIFVLQRFKRIYTFDPEKGYPYLSATEALNFRPEPTRWIARDKAPASVTRHFAKPGWILMTSSGVVGRCILVTKRLEPFLLTHDLLRLLPAMPPGFLYAFLSTWIGQALVARGRYGGVIRHLEPRHISPVPVPILPVNEQLAIDSQIQAIHQLRVEANELLDEARRVLYSELGLKEFKEASVEYLGGGVGPKAFALKVSHLAQRLDASFHHPRALAAVAQLEKGNYGLASIRDIVQRVYIAPRFKRIYVDQHYGVPFLQGSHLPMFRPFDLKYLSRQAHSDLSPWIIRQGWLLVTCSGTIGRIAMVPTAMDGWAASQHIARILPDTTLGDAGFLAAFLMTPHGRHQLLSKVHGGVVDELTESDTAAVLVPNPPLEIQTRIGDRVREAFEKKEQANEIEKKVISDLESRLVTGEATDKVF